MVWASNICTIFRCVWVRHPFTASWDSRTIKVIHEKDTIGISMFFRVNGVDVFCKGADWIPCDAMPTRHTEARYRDLLASARDANMNMLRVWGGGQFENDAFYEICDEMGLMLWHDFMFACSLYPADAAFTAEVDAELSHQLRRLRDHRQHRPVVRR